MPTAVAYVLPPPSSWDEFESICKSSFSLRWSNPDLHRNGRQGQSQNGVDIYGHDSSRRFVGVQCKNTVQSVTEKMINDECLKAEGFNPTISALYIATTAKRDVRMQEYARRISEERLASGKFSVDIVFWQDICEDLCINLDAVRRHYPDYFDRSSQELSSSQLKRSKDIEMLLSLLNVIDFKSVSRFLESSPKYINIKILYHADMIENVVESPVFHIYDEDLKEAISVLVNCWRALIDSLDPECYKAVGGDLVFYMPGDSIQSDGDLAVYNAAGTAAGNLREQIDRFCEMIKTNDKYLGVSLESTCEKAWGLYNY